MQKILWLVLISYPDIPRPRERELVHACTSLKYFFFYDNDNDYNTLQSDDFFGFQRTFICLSANRLNYYLSSSLSPSFSGGLAIRISFSSSSTRVVVPQVILSIKATRNFLNRTA